MRDVGRLARVTPSAPHATDGTFAILRVDRDGRVIAATEPAKEVFVAPEGRACHRVVAAKGPDGRVVCTAHCAAALARGEARFAGADLLALGERAMDRIRGVRTGFVFQDPMSTLTPHRTIGAQLAEVLEHHGCARGAAARRRARELLERVHIDEPARRLGQFPHELSGGQRQRILIAIAIACEPLLLIADEPTTALDVTVQAQVLELLASLRAERRLAIVLISHDFGVVGRLADRLYVMYAGRVVEEGPAEALLASPRHPYTAALLACIPRMDDPPEAPLPPIPGQPPDARSLPGGCAFHPRCGYAVARCRSESPALVQAAGRAVACHFPLPA